MIIGAIALRIVSILDAPTPQIKSPKSLVVRVSGASQADSGAAVT